MIDSDELSAFRELFKLERQLRTYRCPAHKSWCPGHDLCNDPACEATRMSQQIEELKRRLEMAFGA